MKIDAPYFQVLLVNMSLDLSLTSRSEPNRSIAEEFAVKLKSIKITEEFPLMNRKLSVAENPVRDSPELCGALWKMTLLS